MVQPSKITILNVDDDDACRYAIGKTLQHSGFQVKEASTGEEALRVAQEEPDLILLDVNLPDMSGFEVCNTLKSDPKTSSIPVLHLSATHKDDQSKIAGLGSGADGFLTHPIEPEVLIAYIKALLRARSSEKEKEKLIRELQEALAKVKLLSGMLPICASCKQIRDDKGYWTQIETYIRDHSEAEFSHGLCPDCMNELYPNEI